MSHSSCLIDFWGKAHIWRNKVVLTRIKILFIPSHHTHAHTHTQVVCGLYLLIRSNDKTCPCPQGEHACVFTWLQACMWMSVFVCLMPVAVCGCLWQCLDVCAKLNKVSQSKDDCSSSPLIYTHTETDHLYVHRWYSCSNPASSRSTKGWNDTPEKDE